MAPRSRLARVLRGTLLIGTVAGALGAYVWRYAPEYLPLSWRRQNPHSPDYAPAVYRWRDDAGVVQLTDRPPSDRPYETIRVDPATNVVPTTLPVGSDP